jgi:hypothetical protein
MVELDLDIAMFGEIAHGPVPANKTLEARDVIGINACEEFIFEAQQPNSVTHSKGHATLSNYAASAASRLPFSTASSMVPTI